MSYNCLITSHNAKFVSAHIEVMEISSCPAWRESQEQSHRFHEFRSIESNASSLVSVHIVFGTASDMSKGILSTVGMDLSTTLH